jgi:putative PEP-CTERM system histidine kinase
MLSFGFISYGLAATGFLILTLLLAISWEGRGQGVRLVMACGVTAAWAALLAYVSWLPHLPLTLVTFAEFVRDGAWLVVLTGLISGGAWPALISRATHLLVAATVTAAAAMLFLGQRSEFATALPGIFTYGGLAMSLAGLVLVEQVYRNANPAGRFALRYFVVGIGVLFAYDLFLFSQAQLVKGIEASSWQARGLVNALVVPLIALAARANPTWSLNVFVSRQVVFYTTSFLAVGAYLLLMALVGYLIHLYGGTWGRIAQIVFFAGAGMVLVTLMISGSLRRRLRVFLSKHFYRNKYDYRVEWLRFIDTLSMTGTDVDTHGNSVRAIAQIVGSPGGVLFLPLDGLTGYAPLAGWPAETFPRSRYPALAPDEELVDFLRRKQWVFDLAEYRTSPDSYQSIAIPEFLRDRQKLRLIVPLLLRDQMLGLVVLAEPPPPFDLTWEDRDLLKTVGRHVATHLAQHEADRRLAESRQFEAYHRLTAFVMHDLKNLAAQLSLLVANAEKHRRNPDFVDDAIATIANSTARMQRLIEQLQGRESQSANRRVSLSVLAREACERCAVREPAPRCEGLASDALVKADPERLCMMIEHLIRNAQDATPTSGSVRVAVSVRRNVEVESLGMSGIRAVNTQQLLAAAEQGAGIGPEPASERGMPGDFACLTVEDSGSGMTAEFVKERLFRPFDTTKGSKGMGIGAYQVREYIVGLGGWLKVDSEPGRGTVCSVWLPLHAPAAEPAQA